MRSIHRFTIRRPIEEPSSIGPYMIINNHYTEILQYRMYVEYIVDDIHNRFYSILYYKNAMYIRLHLNMGKIDNIRAVYRINSYSAYTIMRSHTVLDDDWDVTMHYPMYFGRLLINESIKNSPLILKD